MEKQTPKNVTSYFFQANFGTEIINQKAAKCVSGHAQCRFRRHVMLGSISCWLQLGIESLASSHTFKLLDMYQCTGTYSIVWVATLLNWSTD